MDNPHHYHTALAFEDVPVVQGFSQGRTPKNIHMEGTRPIYDLDSCLSAEDDIAFIIVRETYCSEGTLSLSQAPLSGPWHENILLKSPRLRSALTSTAFCYISNTQEAQLDGISQVNTREVDSPHLFLYHHRARLRKYAASHPDALSHVSALLEYASRVYGGDYQEADELFSKGLVTRRHLVKLFAPNELVFTYTDGQPTAYVLREWPKIMRDGHLNLNCWSWKPSGSTFLRHKRTLSVSALQFDDEELEIRRLSVLPLACKTPEVRTHLELRGRKHWSLRLQSYVSYNGWNISHDQYYASGPETSNSSCSKLLTHSEQPDSRFMIDYQTYLKLHPHTAAFRIEEEEKLPFDTRPSYLDLRSDGNVDIYSLMAADTYGFYFTEKKWS